MSILEIIIAPAMKVLERLIPDATERAAAVHEITTMAEKAAHEQVKMQLKVNAVEAGHQNIFVSGWRPFIGWVCGTAMAFNFIMFPLAAAVFSLTVAPLPLETMLPVLLGMLGLGGLRTTEKIKGIKHGKY